MLINNEFVKKHLISFITKIRNTMYLFNIVWHDAKLFVFSNAFFTVLNGIIPIVTLNLTKNIINNVEESYVTNVNFPIILIILMLLVSVLAFLTDVLNDNFSAINSEKLSMKMELRILNKVKRIDIINFDKSEFNELYSKIRKGINSNPSEIIYAIFDIIKNIIVFITLLSAFIVLPIGNIKYAMILISIIAALPKRFFVNKEYQMRFKHNDEMNFQRRKVGYFKNLLFNTQILDEAKIYRASDLFINKFRKNSEHLFYKDKELEYKLHLLNRLASIISLIVEKIPYIGALYLAYTKVISIGQFVMLTGAISQMTQAIISCIFSIGDISTNSLYVNYLKEFFEISDKILKNNSKGIGFKRNGGQHTIEFRNVWFSYPGMKEYVLKDVSFKIEAGQTVALVGLNGCGKSTIVKLMMRLYEPNKGKIFIDNIQIEKYNTEQLYKYFGVVFQDYCRYSIPILECIALGDLSKPYDISRAIISAKKCDLHTTIMNTENNYNTLLTKRFKGTSIEFSTGQWQKLSIVRAFYRDSEILILDEPSASLDIETEYKIFNDMERLKGTKTSVFISHNLSSVTICDKIIFIQKGTVAAYGTHQYLMEQNKNYKKLLLYQASRYNKLSS